MFKLETVNELTLKATCDGSGTLFTKAGAYIAGESYGGKNYQFSKVLLGPQGNPLSAAIGQLGRRLTGENLPLMKVDGRGQSITYYANEAQHVTVIRLQQGQRICVESENILAFTDDCRYGTKLIGTGVISQKGLFTSTLTGMGPNAQVAILCDGNPVVISNMQNGSTLTCDPDAHIAHIGADPSVDLDLSWKNLIGQASGESYFLKWTQPATVIIQPTERTSGIDIGIDGRGGKPSTQQNNLFRQDGNQALNGLSNMMNNGSQGGTMGGMNGGQQGGGLSGLGNILGNILNS